MASDKIKRFITEHYEKIIPLLHFLLSFTWQGTIFLGSGNWEYFTSIVRNENVISSANELLLVNLLSRIFCFLIILGFWRIVFFVLRKKVRTPDLIILGSIWLLVLLAGIFLFPDSFGSEIDNYTNFLMARRFQPTYWQSVYTGAFYGGCLMVIPHPFGIFLIQWTFFWSVISYIYLGIGRLSGNSSIRYIVLLFFLLPEAYNIAFNPYRNNLYTVLVLWYIATLYFTIRDRTAVDARHIAMFSLFTAFVMVWRSEGLLIGAGGVLICLFFVLGVQKGSLKKCLILLVTVGACFMLVNQIQALGAKKYYGQDYMIMNTTTVLHSLFNDPEADLSYPGADEDLKAIGSVVPVEVLKDCDKDGYRDYNWTSGRKDFNQTLATDEQASAYMAAYFHIVMYNMNSYLNVQLNSFYDALGIPASRKTYTHEGENAVKLDSFGYDQWGMGRNEVEHTLGTLAWSESRKRTTMAVLITSVIGIWRDLVSKSGLNPLLHGLSIIALALLCAKELFLLLENGKGRKRSLPFIIAFMTILGEYGLILLFMPGGNPAYLYPLLFSGYLVLYLYWLEHSVFVKKPQTLS